MARSELAPDALSRRCDPASFPFVSTDELPDLDDIIGQDRAVEAVSFGIGVRRPGFHVYAMGPEGIGKYTLIRQFLLRRAPSESVSDDWCYVHDFDQPRRPRAIRLPPGRGRPFRDRMAQLVREIRASIPAAFETDEYRNRKQAIEDELKARRDRALAEFERRALSQGVALLRTPIGVGLAPTRGDRVLEADEVAALPEAERATIHEAVGKLEAELAHLVRSQFPRWEREHRDRLRDLNEEVARIAASHLIEDIRRDHADQPEIVRHLDAVEHDVVASADELLAASVRPDVATLLAGRLGGDSTALLRRYEVNLLVDRSGDTGAPVVFEDHPTLTNLVGRIEHVSQLGTLTTDFTLLRAGALHRANGGYLVLDARRVLAQPYAWDELKRALRASEVRIETLGERLGLISTVSLEPEPIPLDVKVILVGDRLVHELLCALDPDFVELFRIQADFEEDLPRTPQDEDRFVRLLGTIARRERLRPLDPTGAARMVEYASRLAGDGERLSTHLRRVTDILREAHELAGPGEAPLIDDDVARAIDARRRRGARLHERVLDEIGRGTILIATDGTAVGQVNGLSVVRLGELAFAWPVRLTARVQLGEGEVIDIEREVELGGPIHSKGVLILGGFLGGRFGRRRPLSLRARLVFEQSYGAVEGDSASLAETCALISAIAEVPLRQSIAVTGSINQHGEVQPIGGVNEKVEGFFDVCRARGLTAEHGVLIPAANAKDLMLRDDVVDAVRTGCFRVVTVATVDDALEELTGLRAGIPDATGAYPGETLNGRVEAGLADLAERARSFSAAALFAGDGRASPVSRSANRPARRRRG